MRSPRLPVLSLFFAAGLVLFAGCSGDETTTNYYILPAPAGSFPGTPVSASNLAEDAKALSPGGQDVTVVRVFWDGHDRQRAVVLFETRVFFGRDESQYHEDATTDPPLPDRMTTSTMKMYFRHVWASYFDGGKLSEPVEIVGKNMDQLAITQSFVSIDESTLTECNSGEQAPWVNVIDTAAVIFYRASSTGAFGSDPSSSSAAARDGDAVILFRARDTDTATTTQNNQVTGEQMATGDGTQGPYGGRFRETPVAPFSVSITDGTETFTDDGRGSLVGDLGGQGGMDYGGGGFWLVFNGNVASGAPITADYVQYFNDNANDRLYTAYFDHSQAAVPWAETEGVLGTGSSSARVFRWGFTSEASAVSSEMTFTSFGPTLNNVSTFGLLADGFLGQAWWGKEANEYDDGATFTHFLVAVWTEMVAGYADSRGAFDKFVGNNQPNNEIDMRLKAAVFNVETGLFGAPQEIHLDQAAIENDTSIPSGFRSVGDSWVHESFITYDNQVIFTYLDILMDNDPAVAPNYNTQLNNEGFDSHVNWNAFQLSAQTTTGSGAFLANSIRLSPDTTTAHLNANMGPNTGWNMPDIVLEAVNEFDNGNGPVVFGADEGLGATYVFFAQTKIATNVAFPNPAPPPNFYFFPGVLVDDADLFAAQVRHTETLPASIFDGSIDRLELDTGSDAITVISEAGATMNFTAGADPNDNRLLIGTSSNNGPVFNEIFFGLVSAGGETRLVIRNIFGPNSAPGMPAYLTFNTAGSYFDRDFSFSPGDQTATIEDTRRGVRDDWRITLNASSEYFLALYRQQDATNQSLEQFPPTTGPVRSHSPDIGLYASRLSTVLAGQTPVPLAGQALVGSSALRLDADFSTTDPTSLNQYREDAVAFQVQSEIEPLFHIQSDPDRINVLFLTIKDDNPALEDARNDSTGNESYDIVKIVQVENGTTLTLRPSQGGVEVARYPFGTLTQDNDYATPENPGTEVRDNFYERAIAVDAGVDGDAVVYFMKPKADYVLVGGVNTAPTPLGMRLWAGNFNGTTSLTTRQISSDAYDADLGADNHARFQVLGLLGPMTRGISTDAPTGRYHMLLWIEDRTASASFIGGGALMTIRYNKAAPGATTSRLVSASDAFTPSISGSSGWPLQADFASGDSVSFPVGFGADTATFSLYLTQFGEIYYNEYSFGSGAWWVDGSGLPAPTLLSNEGFPGMPNAFLAAIGGTDTDMFGAVAFANYMVQEFDATLCGSAVRVRRYDNLHKALVLYAKDDGGWDPEDDGTGYNRLFCRIRN